MGAKYAGKTLIKPIATRLSSPDQDSSLASTVAVAVVVGRLAQAEEVTMDGGSDVAVMDDNRQECSRADNSLGDCGLYSKGNMGPTGNTGQGMKMLQAG